MRLNAGSLMAPTIWPRLSIQVGYWRWQTKFRWRWKKKAHINVLEARAALAALSWRLRRSRTIRSKVFHIVDSQAAQATLSKHRSSSRVLHHVIKRSSLLELAGSVHLALGFCRSDKHPADFDSRDV